MTLDFEGLLEDPVYDAFALAATLTVAGRAALSIDVLESTFAVEEAGAGGIVVGTLKPACDLRLADLTAASLAREDLVKAEISFGGLVYRVLATAPAANSRELRLILVENP